MQNGDTPDVPATAAKPSEPPKSEEVTKRTFRVKVWKHLESNGLTLFPRPVFQRIPNFKGASEAADRLAELDVFKNAQNVWVNPDKPQEFVRIKCLEQKKQLYVPATRQMDGYLCRIELPEGEEDYSKGVSRKGMDQFGKSIGIDELVSLDVLVTGAVAVSKEGYRIGNGRGYSDLEFGLMVHMKSVTPSTVVIAVVHDCQVMDTLPAELFGPHDVPVDIIVTPTQVIETQRMSQRPIGLLWHLISNRRLERVPVLAKLRQIEIDAGRPCPLKEADTDPEDRAAVRTRRRQRHRRPTKESGQSGPEVERVETERKPRRPSQRRASQRSVKEDEPAKPRRPRKPRPAIDFTVKLSNITPNTRVRDLKQALTERGVKPQIMTWKGFRGFCYLHFIKTNNQKAGVEAAEGEGAGDGAGALSMESVLAALKDVQVRGGGGEAGEAAAAPYPLCVEPAPPRPPLPSATSVEAQ